MSRRKPVEPEPVMDKPTVDALPAVATSAESFTASDEVIAPTKAEIKAIAEQAARLTAGLSVPPATMPPNAAAWRTLAEQAAQLAVIASAIADLGEAS